MTEKFNRQELELIEEYLKTDVIPSCMARWDKANFVFKVKKEVLKKLRRCLLEAEKETSTHPECVKLNKWDEWNDEYGDDEDPVVAWEEYRKRIWCDKCDSYQEAPCMCYIRQMERIKNNTGEHFV